MVNKEMKTLTFGAVTYEIVDKKARSEVGEKVPNTDKGKANGVASLDETGKIPVEQLPDDLKVEIEQSDWNETDENANKFIKNKIPITNGTGEKSIVIATGDAKGKYSVAGGTNDSSLVKDMIGTLGSLASIDTPTAYGDMSLSFGAGTKALSVGTIALGANTSSGCKGFYFWSIDFNTKVLTLSTNQKPIILGSRQWTDEAKTQLAKLSVGDKISIVNDNKYTMCSKITAIDSNAGTITVDSLPFTEVNSKALPSFDDYSVVCPTKSDVGVVNLGIGAFSIGLENNAVGAFSHVEGGNNLGAGDYSHVEGRDNFASYASHAEGHETKAIGNTSHSEGRLTIASGINTHAEGCETNAKGYTSHSEGCETIAEGDNSHAEGFKTNAGYRAHSEGGRTKANGKHSHSEGYSTQANGDQSHAEGCRTISNAPNSHAEGCHTYAFGNNSHSEGNGGNGIENITASSTYSDILSYWDKEELNSGEPFAIAFGHNSHIEGCRCIAYGTQSHAEGYKTRTKGDCSHSEGSYTVANGVHSHVEGYYSQANGESSHAEGHSTQANGNKSHSEGCETEANGTNSHAEGHLSQAIGINSHAEGSGTKAYANNSHTEGRRTVTGTINNNEDAIDSHAEGYETVANGVGSHVEGKQTISGAGCSYQHVQGKCNIKDTEGRYANIIGNGTGTSDTQRSNAHTVDWNGNAWYKGSVTSNGADYAEYFEWLDGNPNDEDRVGLLVALDGEKIRLANANDEVLGVISGTAAVLGDNYECEWNGKYLTDDFGRIQYEDVEEFCDAVVGIDEETQEPIIKKKTLGFFKHPIINPNYDSSKEYINRTDRPEWDTVGMLGKLYVRDDGTATVNGYVTVGQNGVATTCSEKTNMRMLSRVNKNVIRVLLK